MDRLAGGYDNRQGELGEVLILQAPFVGMAVASGFLQITVQAADIDVFLSPGPDSAGVNAPSQFRIEKGNVALVWIGGIRGRMTFKGNALVNWRLAA